MACPTSPAAPGGRNLTGVWVSIPQAHLPEVLHLLPLEALSHTAVLRALRNTCRLATGVLRVLRRPATSAGAPLELSRCPGAACLWL